MAADLSARRRPRAHAVRATLTVKLLSRLPGACALVAVAMALALGDQSAWGSGSEPRPRWQARCLPWSARIQDDPEAWRSSGADHRAVGRRPGGKGRRIVALPLYGPACPLVRGVVTGPHRWCRGAEGGGDGPWGSNRRSASGVWRCRSPLPVLMAGVRVANGGSRSRGETTPRRSVLAGFGRFFLSVALPRSTTAMNPGRRPVPAALNGLLADWPSPAVAALLPPALGLRCGPGPPGSRASGWPRPAASPSLAIGLEAFTEQLLLGELLAQQIEAQTNLRVRP